MFDCFDTKVYNFARKKKNKISESSLLTSFPVPIDATMSFHRSCPIFSVPASFTIRDFEAVLLDELNVIENADKISSLGLKIDGHEGIVEEIKKICYVAIEISAFRNMIDS